ncbi:MAG: hypothetical protein QF893_00815 [Alphaproteobacteria bacterium]|jgi:hypothetical protein|nr:hypothetical protein [Alphaproteobacteria bacterium]
MLTGQASARDARFGWAAFLAISAANLALVWWYRHPPTLDGPVHLYISAVLTGYDAPEAAAFRHYFELNPRLNPNLLIYGLLYGLGQFLPLAVAEKVLISGYVVGLPLAVRYAAKPLTAAPWLAALLAMPLALSLTLHLGFYNYSYGLLMVPLALGAYLRADTAPSLGRLLWLGLAGLLVLAAHIFAAMALLLMVAVLALWRAWRQIAGGAGPWPTVRRRLLAPAVALAPTALLVLTFIVTNEAPPSPLADRSDLLYRLVLFTLPGFLWLYSKSDVGLAALLQVLVLLALFHALRSAKPTPEQPREHGFLVVFLVFAVLFFAIPGKAGGGGWMLHRLQPYLYLALVLWLAGLAMRPGFRRGLGLALTALAITTAAYRLPQYGEIDRYRRQFETVLAPLQRGDTVSSAIVGPLVDADGAATPAWRADPLPHLAAYPAAARGAVFLGLYQAHMAVFPIRYRAARDPFQYRVPAVPGVDPNAPRLVDLDAYNQEPDRRLDYLLVVGEAATSRVVAIDRFRRQLARDYRLVREVTRPGPLHLYRHKDHSARD